MSTKKSLENVSKDNKYYQVVLALLSNPTVDAAAKACGLSSETVFRYLKEEKFRVYYDECRAQLMTQALTALQFNVTKAIEVLLEAMKDPDNPIQARISAAKCMLENSLKCIENEQFTKRIELLEARIDEIENK